MTHGSDIGAEGAAAEIVQGGGAGRFGDLEDDRFQHGEHPQAGALAERYQTHSGRDQVRGERLQISRRGGVLRDAVGAGQSADGDRIGDATREVRRTPCGSGGDEARIRLKTMSGDVELCDKS